MITAIRPMKTNEWMLALLLCGSAFLTSSGQDIEITPAIREAAAKGEPAAEYQMARARMLGKGAPKDVNKAYELMKSSAEKGNPDAIGALGYFYMKGIVVEKDGRQAIDWFRKGAELGSAKACLNLGRCLIREEKVEGMPVPANPAEAEKMTREGMEWVRKAADKGLVEAVASMGRCCYFGEHGLARDYKEAARWFRIAAEAGDASSQNYLGVIHDQALLGTRDEAEAVQWFTKAAKQGEKKAQASLGRILGPSSQDKERRIQALAWLIVATDAGEITAKKSMEDAKPSLRPGDLEEAEQLARKLRAEIRSKSGPFSSISR